MIGWLLIRAGTSRFSPDHAQVPGETDGFQVFVFVNDEDHWAQMSASFVAAGFREPVRLDDRESSPYETITWLGKQDGYAILCHQDVRVGQGVGERELRNLISEIGARDPCWTVAGVAGITPKMRVVRRVVDRFGGSTGGPVPARVVTLDENFLVLNCNRSPRCSAALSGFHFYGTDVCLNAIEDGGTAYVIDFPVRHLGRGEHTSAYHEMKRRFLNVWTPRFRFRYIGTPTETLFISRSTILRRIFGSSRVLAWVQLHRRS